MQTKAEPVSNEPTRSLASDLEEHGITVIPNLVSGDQLSDMQRVFEARLKRLSWNDFSGYEKTTRNRHMVQDVLALEQGFVDAAIHPVVKTTLNEYLGPRYELVEAKGWLSLAPRKDFHAWHGDMWYDKDKVAEPPREAKLAIYLTDVTSGAFVYIRGTHGKMEPRVIHDHEIGEYDESQIVEVKGAAGTGILFDTSGVHRQGVPILEPRQAVFYCYHDPLVPLQKEDLDYNRYHPLLLNAALLGGLDPEDHRILGFGNKTNFVPAFERSPRHEGFQRLTTGALEAKLMYEALRDRVRGRLQRVVRAGQ